jgi:hypothetical protein
VDYTFPEPFGEAKVHYAFEVGRMVLLTSTYIVPIEALEPGMRFFLEDGQIATVTHVDAPKVWEPPWSLPDENGNFDGRVIGTIKRTGFMALELVIGGQSIRTTPSHPFWSVDRQSWVDAGDLLLGERLWSEDGQTVAVDYIGQPQTGRIELFNFEVEEFHTYFVGTPGNAALVHNGIPGPGTGCGIPQPAPTSPAKGWKSTNALRDLPANATSAQRQAATGINSRRLRRNMGSAVKEGQDAHHIVASTHDRAEDARAILDKYQVDINDAVNGVGLKPTGSKPAHHGHGLHSHAGIDAVTDRLRNAVRDVDDWATGRAKVLEELDNIRSDILSGTFP